MAVCPFAIKKLIAPGSNDPRIPPRLVILHVDAGNAWSLFKFFKYRSGGIESHFHIRNDGEIEQYRDTDWQADANHLANDFAISIETQGFGFGKWNAKQLASIKRLLLWINEVHPAVELRTPTAWNGTGVGYHIQMGTPGKWTPVSKSCPGPERIKQYNNDIVPWLKAGAESEDELLTPQDFWTYQIPIAKGKRAAAQLVLRWARNDAARSLSELRDVRRRLRKLERSIEGK